LTLDSNDSYDPDTTHTPHPLLYAPHKPTLSTTHDGKLATLIASCGLIDPLAHQHSSRPFPASHIRGSKRIDFILISANLQSAVLQSGCLSFYSIMRSDHRGYFLDLSSTALFAENAHDISRLSFRRLRLQDPRLTKKYIETLHIQLQHHSILQKVNDLLSAANSGTWTPTQTAAFQNVDMIITQAILHAENTISKHILLQYQWSPDLKRAVQAVRYSSLLLKTYRGQTVSPRTLDHLLPEGFSTAPTITTEAEAIDLLRRSYNNLRSLQSSH